MNPLHDRGPLRIIAEELEPTRETIYGRRKVRLQCGHVIWVGAATTYRARCRHCLATALQRLARMP
jgi:thymidine kinase